MEYAPIRVEEAPGMFVPPSSGSYGAAGTSSRDDVPKKPRSVVGQLFGSSASVPVVIGIGVIPHS